MQKDIEIVFKVEIKAVAILIIFVAGVLTGLISALINL